MSLFLAILRALAPLFGLIVLGYGLKRLRVLHISHVPVMNGLVINVTLPALIVQGLVGAPRLPAHDGLAPLALLLAQFVTLGVALAVGRAAHMARPTHGALMITGAFGNTGFLGYPIVLALLPREFPVAILLDQFGMTIALYLCAALLGGRFGPTPLQPGETRQAIIRFLRSPLFLSVVVGMLIRLIPWPTALSHTPAARAVGGIVMQCLGYLGQGTTPVVLLALGVALRPGAVRAYVTPLALACTLKLLVCPLAMWAIAHALGLHGDLLRVCLLMSAMPTAVVASVLSAQHDLSGDYAVAVVFVSTVLSAVTIPLLLSILG
ncbi:MAG: AEC family transporter [Armatimonadota bacterium]|nr:AEC family transporter [Armatimonadota bacterium]